MRVFLVISIIFFSSCATYKKSEIVNEWKTSYGMVFTVERVKIYDRKTDTLRLVRMDTIVLDINEWRKRRYFKEFDF